MYAIFEIGNKQYKVAEGLEIKVDLLNAKIGEEVTFENVISVSKDDAIKIGHPYLPGANIKAKVLKHEKSKKIMVLKYKPKKHYRVRSGHRQDYTLVKIEKIKLTHKKSAGSKEEHAEGA